MTNSKSKIKRDENDRIVIKKYANRRLYNTATSAYVTLDNLSEMVRDGADFVVYDAKTGDDITRSVLAQIIFDEESRGQNLLPIQFLRQLISFYGDSMQTLLPTYLEMSLDGFSKQQERFRSQFQSAFGSTPFSTKGGIGLFEEPVKQNLAMFDRAMRLFSPFNYPPAGSSPGADFAKSAPRPEAAPESASPTDSADVAELKAQIAAMREQLDALSKKV